MLLKTPEIMKPSNPQPHGPWLVWQNGPETLANPEIQTIPTGSAHICTKQSKSRNPEPQEPWLVWYNGPETMANP